MTDHAELKMRLIERQNRLKQQINALNRDISKSHTADWPDQAQERENDEVVDQLAVNVEQELNDIASALDRLEKHRYGICVNCKAEISPDRLDIMPEAALCIRCADEKL